MFHDGSITASALPEYGYMWWLNTGKQPLPSASESVYYAAGFGGNYIVVDQENDLVIVTRWLEPSQLVPFLLKVYQSIN